MKHKLFIINLICIVGTWAAAEVRVEYTSGQSRINAVVNSPLRFNTNSTERVRILSTGDVGIGTTTPLYKLDVAGVVRSSVGGIRLPDGTTLTTAMTASTGNTSTTDLTFNADNDTNGSGAFIFNTAGTEKMRILNGGNVGVGTMTPVTLFNISSATGSVITLARDSLEVFVGDTIGKIQFWNNDADLATQKLFGAIEAKAALDITSDAAAGVLAFFTTGSTAGGSPVERMRIDESGFVAIGTTTPVANFIVRSAAAETIAAGGTITANQCGTIKKISSGGGVTTNTTDTFTTPNLHLDGCCMDVVNAGASNIILDNNANFASNGAGNVTLGARDAVRVCCDGTRWYQITPRANN